MSDNENILNDIDNFLNSQNLNTQIDDTNINVDDVLKLTEDYTIDINTGSSKALEFLNSTEKNLNELHSNESSSIKKSDTLNEMLNIDIIKIKKEEKKKKEIEIPKFNNSIEFINYMETEYIESTIKKNENIFKLSTYRRHTTKKPTVLQFPNKDSLTEKINRETTPITSITANEEYIFTGDSIGKIKMFSIDQECEIKSFIHKDINNSKVISMDISNDKKTLLSGYSNGNIALWDLKFGKIKKLLKEEHENAILCCKFLLCNDYVTEFVSSDFDGVVNKIILTQNFLYLNVNNVNIIYYKVTPFYQIDILQINEEKNYICYQNYDPQIISIASTEVVLIYQLKPEPKQLYKIHRPLYFSNSFIPDISFGFGYIPRNIPSKFLEVLKENEISKLDPNPIARINDIDINKQYRLFAVSWEKIVYIYAVKIHYNYGFQDLILVGHYVNSNQILRMGFLTNSILYTFDMYKSFKILNTGLMTPGDIVLGEDFNVIPQINKKFKPELNDIKMDELFLFQTFIKDLSEKKKNKRLPTYNNFIINHLNSLYILTKKNFAYGKLLNWEQSINNLTNEGEWIEGLTLGVDIYNGKNISFPDIPIDENERKNKVGNTLKGIIFQYCIINIENGDLNNCLDICMEFCILIDDIDYLINKIKPIFDNKKLSETFIEKLEPFILNDNMKNQNIGSDSLLKIADFYIKKNNIETLGLIFNHLNLSCFYSDKIIDICIKYKLITPLIDIYMNNNKEKYFEPILTIYKMYLQSKEIEYDKFISYEDALNTISLFELINSKQYIGDKLLWYINLCIDGYKYPKKEKINEKKYEFLIKDIFLWMIKKTIFTELINFDSLSVFSILTRLFTDNTIFASLFTLEYDPKQFEGIIFNNEQIKNSNIYILLNTIIENANNMNQFSIHFDLYYFIIQIAIKIGKLDNGILLDAAKFLINIENNVNQYKSEIDTFGFRNKNFSKNDIIDLSKKINSMINNSKLIFKENEYNELLKATQNTSFILVKINLLNILNEDIKCLNVYLFEYNFDDQIKKTFDFIDEILRKYNSHDQKKFKEFKNYCMEKLIDLCKLSSEHLFKLIIQWYNNNHNLVLEKLSTNKLIQLDYLEKVLSNYKEDYLPIDDNEILMYQNLLNLHIDLLCECNKKEEILPNLKKRSSYPIECLDKFLKYEVYDACIYFYIEQNNLEDALNLSNKLLKEGIEKIIKDLKTNKGNNYDSLLKKHEENLDRSIYICQQDFIDDEIREKSWLELIQICYDFRNNVKKNQIESFEINTEIGNNIQKVFESMYSYVKITNIMSSLTQQNKEIEYKEFKPILIKMLNGFTHSRKILELISNIFTINILKSENELIKISTSGNYYDVEKCDICNHEIKKEDVVCLFKCNHKIHFMCSMKEEDEILCTVCIKNEVENAISSFDKKEKKISNPEESDMDNFINNEYENNLLERNFYELNQLNKDFLYDNLEKLNFKEEF